MVNDPVITARRLSFRHGHACGAPALDSIDLTVVRGEFVVITGPSGCGKSTLCMCLSGLIPHAIPGLLDGQVLICGRDTRDYQPGEIARFLTLTFQSPDDQLFSNSVEAEIAFGPEQAGISVDMIEERITSALSMIDAQHLRYRLVDELSGGEKQRVAIAAAMALQPSVLVLDEPTSELDPVAAADLIAALKKMNREHNVTIIVVEHRLERLYGVMDRLIVLDRGKIVADGPPDTVFSRDMAKLGIAEPPAAAFRRRYGYVTGPVAWRSICRDQGHARGDCAISLRDSVFSYPGAVSPALDGLSIDFYRGEIAVIMGANGSGKTTLIKHCNGLLRPDSGSVLVDGEDIRGKRVAQIARKVGIVFQSHDRQMFAETVFGELAFGPENMGFSAGEVIAAVSIVAEELEITHLLGRSPFTLSGGEKQRVAIGSMLTPGPMAIVLDEPTLGLGHGLKEKLADILVSLKQADRAIIVVTHDLEFAAAHADRVLVLAGGRVLADGGPREVLCNHRVLADASLHMPQATEIGESLGLHGILAIDEIVRER